MVGILGGAGAGAGGFASILQNPMFQAGIGMLSNNQGVTGDAAFRNSLGGGMSGALQGQNMMQRTAYRKQLTELAQLQQMQLQRAAEEQRRLAAAAPQLATGLLSQDPQVQQQAVSGLISIAPQLLPKMLGGMLDESGFSEKLRLAGIDPSTPEGQAFVRDYMSKAGVSITQPPKPPSGYWYKDPGDPTQGIERMAGFMESPEKAGKRAALLVGRDQAFKVRDALIGTDEQGRATIDRKMIAMMQGNVPWSEGRQRRQELEDSLQAKLRAETGAAANKEEIASILSRYLPSLMDSDESVISKMNRLSLFFDRVLEETDPALFAKLRARAAQGQPESDQNIPPDKPPWELNQ